MIDERTLICVGKGRETTLNRDEKENKIHVVR